MDTNSEMRVVKVGEGCEAEHVETTDCFFDKIGESVPLTPKDSYFDLQNPPSFPLVVSERFRLIFVVHPSNGFCVAKTVDVINLAKNIKNGRVGATVSSVLDVSVVQVSIGKVSVLSLSADSSILIASVGADIHFFSVASLLAKDRRATKENSSIHPDIACLGLCKEKEPLFLLSIGSTMWVKDLCWTKGKDTSFLVLSSTGALYSGDTQGQHREPLKHLMESVDAVEWSAKGEYLAVARKQVVSILTPEFNERQNILLEFKLGFVGSTISCAVRVDRIQWIRPDCIVLGCFQQAAVGKEENYLVQVIMCKNGKEITHASSQPVILSLSDLFLGIVDDIVPTGYGPHLLLSYLERRQLAILANMKNTDEHIVLVGWLDGSDEPAVVHIERDNCLPRITVQENGDDNVLLGLCIDRASIYEKIKVKLEEEDQRELSPDCIILCLTHEGKLVLFHFASVAGDSLGPQDMPVPSDQEEISTIGSLDVPTVSTEHKDVKVKLDFHSHNASAETIAVDRVHQNHFEKDGESTASLTSTGRTTGDRKEHIRPSIWVPKSKDQIKPDIPASVNLESGKSLPVEKESLNQISLKSITLDAPEVSAENYSKSEKAKLVSPKVVSDYSSRNNTGLSLNILQGGKLRNSTGVAGGECKSSGVSVSRGVAEQGAATFSDSFNSSSRKAIEAGQLNSVSSSMGMGIHGMPVQGHFVPGKAISHVGSPLKSMHPNFEANLSKKYGNVKDMISELDKLVDCIEEPGGFLDACTNSQKSLLEILEMSMKVLCQSCTSWQSLLDERAELVQHLLDNTVQVLARKIYMESIVRQTKDKQYWDLWSRQKLSSELEIKRRGIIDLSQEVVNQLIELEKHFNSLELNNYSKRSGDNLGDQSPRSKRDPSWRIQSLRAVHNALNSQLAVAEQLSENLSSQLAVLSIKSPPAKPGNVKNQLFKMIGIADESDSEVSSQTRNAIDPTNVTPKFSSAVASTGNDFRSNQASMYSHEPETARRRRDSVHKNWANFEPSKTTIKRMLRGNEGFDVQRASFLVDRRFSSSFDAAGSVDTPRDFASRSLLLSTKDLHDSSISSVDRGSGWQIVDNKNLGVSSLHLSNPGQVDLHANQIIAEPPDHEKSRTYFSNAPSSLMQLNFERARSPVLQFSKTASDTAVSFKSQVSASLESAGSIREQKISEALYSLSRNFHETEQSPSVSPSVQTAAADILTGGTQSSQGLATSPTEIVSSLSSSAMDLPSNLFSSSSPAGQLYSSTASIESLTSVIGYQNKFGSASRATKVTVSSASSVAAFSPLSSKTQEKASTSSEPSSVNSGVKPLNAEHQSLGDKARAGSTLLATSSNPTDALSKSHTMSASSFMPFSVKPSTASPNAAQQTTATDVGARTSQKEISTSEVSWNFSPASKSLNLTSTQLASGSHLSLSNSEASSPNVISASQTEKSPMAFPLPPAHVSKSEVRTVDSAVIQEDEMEEEVPETNRAADLGLGSLGVLGLSTGPSATFRPNPSPNPFGSPTISTAAATMSASLNMTVPSGQLFRPSSFNFQPLQTSQPTQPGNAGAFSFGQASQVGSGQQALGSVLGSFGQSRQFGVSAGGQSGGFTNSAGSSGFPSVSASSGGFATGSATGGFAKISTGGGGFASVSPAGGGFAGVSAAGGGFAGVSPTGGGFAAAAAGGFAGAAGGGGGFAVAAGAASGGFAGAAGGGGGFGAFSNQGGGVGFSSFGSGVGGKQPPSQLFTQMRK